MRVLVLYLTLKNGKNPILRSVSFKVFLHFIVKLKPKVIANLPLLVGLRAHPLNENVSEAIMWRLIHCLLQKDGRMSRYRGFTSFYEKVQTF